MPFKFSFDVALLLLSLEDEDEEDMLSKESFNKVCMLKKHFLFHHRQEYSALLMVKAVAAIATVVKVQLNCSEPAYLRHTFTNGKQTMVTIVFVHGTSTLFSQL